MTPYKSKHSKLPGTSYSEVRANAKQVFNVVRRRTKRRPYVRSAYFKRQKVFLDYYWSHLLQKNPRDRMRRLKYFQAALDVIRNSKNQPLSTQNRHKKNEILYRFAGLTTEGELFYVQIKENKRSGRKQLMSCFSPQQ